MTEMPKKKDMRPPISATNWKNGKRFFDRKTFKEKKLDGITPRSSSLSDISKIHSMATFFVAILLTHSKSTQSRHDWTELAFLFYARSFAQSMIRIALVAPAPQFLSSLRFHCIGMCICAYVPWQTGHRYEDSAWEDMDRVHNPLCPRNVVLCPFV
jgi:hypothetical protein